MQIGQSLLRALQDADYSIDWVRDGDAGSAAIAATEYAVVLLDPGLPGMGGIESPKGSRAAGNKVPVLILTARDDLEARIQGLDVGVDDYVLKPFNVPELLACIRAVLRRKAGYAVSRLGDNSLNLDLDKRRLFWNGMTSAPSAREFALMLAFLERPGTILSRDQLDFGTGDNGLTCKMLRTPGYGPSILLHTGPSQPSSPAQRCRQSRVPGMCPRRCSWSHSHTGSGRVQY